MSGQHNEQIDTLPASLLERAAQTWILDAAAQLNVFLTDFEALNLARAVLSDADKTIARELTVLSNLRCRPL